MEKVKLRGITIAEKWWQTERERDRCVYETTAFYWNFTIVQVKEKSPVCHANPNANGRPGGCCGAQGRSGYYHETLSVFLREASGRSRFRFLPSTENSLLILSKNSTAPFMWMLFWRNWRKTAFPMSFKRECVRNFPISSCRGIKNWQRHHRIKT